MKFKWLRRHFRSEVESDDASLLPVKTLQWGRKSQEIPGSAFRLVQNFSRDLFAMIVRVAEHNLRSFRALVIKLQVVLPREANAAVNLRAAIADFARGVGTVSLGDRYR